MRLEKLFHVLLEMKNYDGLRKKKKFQDKDPLRRKKICVVTFIFCAQAETFLMNLS